jgi:hypothetical protein
MKELRIWLADAVSRACDGEVSAADVLSGASFLELGVTSLAKLRLLDDVEGGLQVTIDDLTCLDALDSLEGHLLSAGARTPVP